MNVIFKYIFIVFQVFKIVLFYVLELLVDVFCKKKEIWVISERGFEARDNGFTFFCWLKNNHPEIKVVYVISKDSKDLYKLNSYSEDIVFFNTLKHYYILAKARYLISTHICGYKPKIGVLVEIDRRFDIFRGKKRIFLQHGIIKDDIEGLYKKNNRLDLFICGARKEYEYILKKYGYSTDCLKYTGLCRFDNLDRFENKRQILVMPTWRNYIDRNNFSDSDYYKTWVSFLEDAELHKLLTEWGGELLFYPHYEFQNCIGDFKKLQVPSSIIIANMDYDVQCLLKESSLLITDFSSVFFDMSYMLKPSIFFQFDNEKFFAHHYKKGYLNYSDFGPVCTTKQELIDAIRIQLINCSYIDTSYYIFAKDFFEIRDKKNCERVYENIIRL